MKKEPLLAAAPRVGALPAPMFSTEVLLPPKPSGEPRWRELPSADRPPNPIFLRGVGSGELKRPHRASWELLLDPGASPLAPLTRRELPKAGGESIPLSLNSIIACAEL